MFDAWLLGMKTTSTTPTRDTLDTSFSKIGIAKPCRQSPFAWVVCKDPDSSRRLELPSCLVVAWRVVPHYAAGSTDYRRRAA